MEEVSLIKLVRGNNTYTSAIDTSFTELISPTVETPAETVTVARFFELYDQLFFDIPVTGELNSHEYLVNRSREYLGGSLIDAEKQALIDEINALRAQIIELNSTFGEIDGLTNLV
jgi:hypothetical protein